jgi:hypothetical protein
MAVVSLQKQPGEAAGDRLPSVRDKGVDARISPRKTSSWMPASSQPVILARKNIPDSPARRRESICIGGAWIPRNDDFRDSCKIPGNLPLEGCFFAQIGSRSATVGGGGYDEVQGGHRLHSR